VTVAATLLGDRYTPDERIAAGGYCEVWRATDTVVQAVVEAARAGRAIPPTPQY
jgi:hypothetical protein